MSNTNFSIQLKDEIDKASKASIERDLVKLQNQLVPLQLKIDTTDIDKSLQNICQKTLPIQLSTPTYHGDRSNLSSNISQSTENQSETIEHETSLSKIKNQYEKLGLTSNLVMFGISQFGSALTELKEVDTLLTEISKTNDHLSVSDLKTIGNDSFEIASKYGKKATDYLSGVQEASRAGYANAEKIAELALAAESAGNMTSDLANQYIIATDQAYQFEGSVEKLTEVLDGSNSIASHNDVNMTELAEGMSIVGFEAANLGIQADQTTAALGTMIATTQQSGSKMAHAFKAILLNVQQICDEEEGIDAEGLSKYENACNALNVKLKETKNGVLSLRNPMDVLKDLSTEYSKLDSDDIRRTNLLNSVGGNFKADALNAILENYDMYENMLQQYANGTGFIATEAEKTANSWEGSMNRLSNTWTDTVGNIADSDVIITGINGLNGLLSVINGITDALGSWKSIGLGVGLFAGINNVGGDKMFSPVLNMPTIICVL